MSVAVLRSLLGIVIPALALVVAQLPELERALAGADGYVLISPLSAGDGASPAPHSKTDLEDNESDDVAHRFPRPAAAERPEQALRPARSEGAAWSPEPVPPPPRSACSLARAARRTA